MRQYLQNKKNLYLSAGTIILLITVVGLIAIYSTAKRELKDLRIQQQEINAFKAEFKSLKLRIDEIERKKKLTKVSGIISSVDEIFSSLGLKNKIKSVKHIGERVTAGDIEEDAEVFVEKLSMNEMVNLFYRIENAPMLFILKKASIKTSFERSDLLNLTLTVSLVHEK